MFMRNLFRHRATQGMDSDGRRVCRLLPLPQLAVARGTDHQRERPHVRRRAARARRLPEEAPGRGAVVRGSGRLGVRAPCVRRGEPPHPLDGLDDRLEFGVAILIGYVLLAANCLLRLNPRAPELDLKAAQWLPAYLVGMGLIVYLSDFGPLSNPVFPLWWDMLAATVSSLASTTGPARSRFRPSGSSG